MFSKDDENASPDAEAANSSGQPPQQPFMNPQQSTGDGNFQAMFEQSPGAAQPGMPMAGGSGGDPRAVNPAAQRPAAAQGIQQHYLASELLAFIPPALAAQGGIPMEQTIALELPADGSTEVRLSAICAACPQLFAVEITPLNDSVITLPPRLAAPPQAAPKAAAPAEGMDLASMRANAGGSPFANNPFADAVQSPIHPQHAESATATAAADVAPAPSASPFGAPPASSAETPSQFGFPSPPPAGSGETQSAFSPFGAAPKAAPAEPSGATPTVGFSAIGPIPGSESKGEGASSVFGPTAKSDAIFPGGNPFDEPAATPPASAAPEPEAAGNPFGGGSPFGAPVNDAAPAPNPFDSSASFSTIFSEKAQEDERVEQPGIFGSPASAAAEPVHAVPEEVKAPEADLPTVDEALPPQASDALNPFAQFEASPTAGANPFGQLGPDTAPPAEEEDDFADALPPKPDENLASPFAQSAKSPFESAAESPRVEIEAKAEPIVPERPTPQPSAGFEPPAATQPAVNLQRSPFDPIERPAERPAPAAAPESTPVEPEAARPAAFDSDESDSFDDLSPFTAAVGARNSFFDELANAEPEAKEPVQESAPEPPAAEVAPEPKPVAAMSPAPRDSVVKNIELRAVFGSDEDFTPDLIAVKTVGIEGIATCAIQIGDETRQAARAGQPTMALSQISSLSESARQIAALTGVADAGAFTMHTDKGLISIFSHEAATLFVRHLSGEFDPGVREKLMLITRGAASL